MAVPDWTGSISASYDFPINSSGLRIGLSTSALYSDSYEVTTAQVIGSRQKSYVNIDATLRLFTEDDRWELALIGKNLTDQLRVKFASEAPGTPALDPTFVTGTGTAGPGIRGMFWAAPTRRARSCSA